MMTRRATLFYGSLSFSPKLPLNMLLLHYPLVPLFSVCFFFSLEEMSFENISAKLHFNAHKHSAAGRLYSRAHFRNRPKWASLQWISNLFWWRRSRQWYWGKSAAIVVSFRDKRPNLILPFQLSLWSSLLMLTKKFNFGLKTRQPFEIEFNFWFQ